MRMTDLHQYALRAHQSRGSDWLAMVVMLAAFICALAIFESVAISVLDWLDGKPNSVIPAIRALLDVLDGGR